MKKIISAILVFVLTTLQINTSFGQAVKAFTQDNDQMFFQELTLFFESADKSYGKDYVQKFITFYTSNALTGPEKVSLKKMSNAMLKRRLKAFPDFENYYECFQLFKSTKHSVTSFAAWLNSTEFFASPKMIGKFNDYISTSRNLLEKNIIYQSPLVTWSANLPSFEFQMDSLPSIILKEIDLQSCSKNDTLKIYKTSGKYFPISDKWIGKGGKITWWRAQFSEKETWADIQPNLPYYLDFKLSTLKIDSVIYYNSKYFTQPLLGTIEDKCFNSERGEACLYPKFDSYTKRFKLPNLSTGIEYEGGFSMHGAKFIGSGTIQEPAKIKIKVKDKLFFVAQAKGFIIRPERISSENAQVNMYNGTDSIYHPGIIFKLDLKDRKVTLIREDQGKGLAPLIDSYHKIELFTEALYWKIDEQTIEMKKLLGSSLGDARFESQNYFRSYFYDKLQGMDEIHPIQQIKGYSDKNGKTKVIDIDKLAAFMRYSPEAIKPFLVTISNLGLVNMDFGKNQITLLDKFFFYIGARNSRVDFDVIELNSDIKGESNATLNLLNWDLKLRGVNRVQLSDSQNVYIYPRNRELTMQKNRAFTFAGRIYAGRFEFFGKEFLFDYTNFKIDLNNTDSLRFKVQSKDVNPDGTRSDVYCKSVLENINGELLIDKPYNKSGAKSFPEYPIFKSNKPSYIYYDKSAIFGGVYKRDKFYFQLEPFTIDSLDNFSNIGLNFAGTFQSAGILPTMPEQLRLQDDYSLGFEKDAPVEGFPTYGTKGTLKGKVKLSNKGLRANGDLKYITSLTQSDDMIYFPDSMHCISKSYTIPQTGKGGVEFPNVVAEGTFVRWLPKKDIMYNYSKEKPIAMYDEKTLLKGTLILEPKGLSAKGRVDFNQAFLTSSLIKFKSQSFDSDTSNFALKEESKVDELSFNTFNVKAHIDYEKRLGEFTSNGGASKVLFPQNQYMCYMDQFKWFMDKQDIELSASKNIHKGDFNPSADIDIDGPEFVSTHPDQDSLRFKSMNARYDIKNKIIYCKNVKLINIADSRAYPDSGKVVIRKNAEIDELKNDKLVANGVTKYHNIYNAQLKLFSRKSYIGNGTIDYVDDLKQKFPIKLTKIEVDSTTQTVAEGTVADSSKFKLSPQFDYIGKVKLIASDQDLIFKGSARLAHECTAIRRSWLNFEGKINPAKIMIPISSDLQDRDNNKLTSGLALTNNDSVHVYAAFLSKKDNYSDQDIITAEGFLTYDKVVKEYQISSVDKLKERNFAGNYISLKTSNCLIYGEGKLGIVKDMGQVKISTVGSGTYNLINNEANLDILMGVNFFFDDGAMKGVTESLEAKTDAEAVNTSRPTYEKGLRELLNKEDADKLISQINLYGTFKKLPDELEQTFFFNELKLKWNQPSRSFQSVGKLGIASMFKTQLNKKVDGYMEIIKKRSGEQLNLYIKLDEENWYFFNYANGLMQAISSDAKFNEAIKLLKPEKRRLEVDKGQKAYAFILSTEKKKKDFVKKMESKNDDEDE